MACRSGSRFFDQIDKSQSTRNTKVQPVSFFKASSLLVILFVLLLFFFPVASGPYSALHGPATAMRASRAAKWIFWIITLCGGLPLLRRTIAVASGTQEAVLSLSSTVQMSILSFSLRC